MFCMIPWTWISASLSLTSHTFRFSGYPHMQLLEIYPYVECCSLPPSRLHTRVQCEDQRYMHGKRVVLIDRSGEITKMVAGKSFHVTVTLLLHGQGLVPLLPYVPPTIGRAMACGVLH